MIGRRAHWTLAVLALLLGLGHMSFLAAAPRWSPDVAWFAGTGLAFILGGLLSIAAIRARDDRLVRGAAAVGALLLAGFALAVWTVVPQPQVIAAGVLFAALAGLAAFRR